MTTKQQPTTPGAPAALPVPTADPVDARPVRVALALAYPDKLPPRLGSDEAYRYSITASGAYAPWHRPTATWQAEAFGDDSDEAA